MKILPATCCLVALLGSAIGCVGATADHMPSEDPVPYRQDGPQLLGAAAGPTAESAVKAKRAVPTDRAVSYEAFGAIGDGVADDLPAIVEAHAFANAHGLSVQARPVAAYHLGRRSLTAVIATDTDWGTARFIIDDTDVEDHRASLFAVRSLLDPVKLAIPRLTRDQRRLDERPLVLKGGVFSTIANRMKQAKGYNYWARNIAIQRSNTSVVGLALSSNQPPAPGGQEFPPEVRIKGGRRRPASS